MHVQENVRRAGPLLLQGQRSLTLKDITYLYFSQGGGRGQVSVWSRIRCRRFEANASCCPAGTWHAGPVTKAPPPSQPRQIALCPLASRPT